MAITDSTKHNDNVPAPRSDAGWKAEAARVWSAPIVPESLNSWRPQAASRGSEPQSLDLGAPIPGYDAPHSARLLAGRDRTAKPFGVDERGPSTDPAQRERADAKERGDLRDHLRNSESHERVDYGGIARDGARFIGFAETHETMTDRKEFIKSLPEMKAAGVTHVAIEGLRSDALTTKLLDDYARARKTNPESDESKSLRKQIGDQLGPAVDKTHDGASIDPRKLEQHLKMIDAAVDNGLKVMGVEPPKERDSDPSKLMPILMDKLGKEDQAAFDTYFSKDATDAQRASAREQLLAKLRSASPSTADSDMKEIDRAQRLGMDYKGIALGTPRPADRSQPGEDWQAVLAHNRRAGLDLRDREMASAIEGVLAQPGTKVLFFSGAAHLGYGTGETPTVTERLTKYGTTVIGFSGGDYPQEAARERAHNLPQMFQAKVTEAARDAGLADQYFQLRLSGRRRSADVIIHAPEETR